ncbi:MAG: DNA-3-methyladenine glycosylase 2 family protein [Acidobacteria bacterium]|nr:DNA-3-methyladenine glycosylase 2 family protein [Acidobacteriota bacterium]
MRKAVNHLKKADPVLCRIIERVGPCRIQYRTPEFASLAQAIVYQQLNGTAAATIFRRTLEAVGNGRLTPKAVLRTPVERLRAAGLSAAKTAYIRDLAEKTAAGAIRFRRLPALSDQEVIAVLTQVKGIGVWSAHMFLLFALRRPNVLATGDYGVRAAVQKAYGLGALPKPAELEQIARPWHPYCSIACWYLWRSLEAD